MCSLRREQPAQGMRGVGTIVRARDQGPLVKDVPIHCVAVVPAGVHERVERPGLCHRDHRCPFVLRRRMKRDRQAHRFAIVGEAEDAGNDAYCAQRHARRTERQPRCVTQDVRGGDGGVVVVQRLAHAHQHDVAQSFAGAGEHS